MVCQQITANRVSNTYTQSRAERQAHGEAQAIRAMRAHAGAALACLPEQGERLPTEDHCTIIGWGKEKKSHFFGTEVLHEARVSN